MIVVLAALLVAIAGTGRRPPAPVVFPHARGVPLDVHFLVLEPVSAEHVRLTEEDGTPVPARVRRARGVPGALEVVPEEILASEHVYCVEVAYSELGRSCAETGTSTDEQAPTGGAPRAVTVVGGEAHLEIDRGEDTSDVAMELEVRRPWTRACRDLAIGLGEELRRGGTLDLYGIGPGAGTTCFPFDAGPQPRVRLRIRWRDATGNVGPWSEVWELPAGADGGKPQVFQPRYRSHHGHGADNMNPERFVTRPETRFSAEGFSPGAPPGRPCTWESGTSAPPRGRTRPGCPRW